MEAACWGLSASKGSFGIGRIPSDTRVRDDVRRSFVDMETPELKEMDPPATLTASPELTNKAPEVPWRESAVVAMIPPHPRSPRMVTR